MPYPHSPAKPKTARMHDRISEVKIVLADERSPDNDALRTLLHDVYVDEGYTEKSVAQAQFEPEAVRQRGFLYIALDTQDASLVGMVILVPPSSPACRLAQQDEAELHLLAVKPEFRGQGVGKKLIQSATDHARREGYQRLVLWTQASMIAAQHLYHTCGFKFIENFTRANTSFKLYHKTLNSSLLS